MGKKAMTVVLVLLSMLMLFAACAPVETPTPVGAANGATASPRAATATPIGGAALTPAASPTP